MLEHFGNEKESLRKSLSLLARIEEHGTVKPEPGRIYKTFDNSIVVVLRVHEPYSSFSMFMRPVDGDEWKDKGTQNFVVQVIEGGHGQDKYNGEKPGDKYLITIDGAFSFEAQKEAPVICAGMSLYKRMVLIEDPSIDDLDNNHSELK